MRVQGLVVIGLVGIAIWNAGSRDPDTSAGVNNSALSFCKTQPDKAKRILTHWTDGGVIKRTAGDRLVVNEDKWKRIPHDMKVSIALAGYCGEAVAQNGRNTFYVWGWRDGEIHASVDKGHYFY